MPTGTTAEVALNVVARDFASSTLRGIGRVGESLANRLTNAGRQMTMAFTVPFASAAGAAFKLAADFEKSMTLVEVAAQRGGETSKQLSQELRDLALETSKNTIFSLEETSTAMLELARAGIVTAKDMAQTLPDALDLAAAGQVEAEDATRALINILNQFGLGVEESTRVVDALAKTAVVSTTDVREMIQAFEYAGTTSDMMGLSIEDAATAIGIMSDAGVRGGRAGRTLRMMLKSLADPSEEAKDKLRELGITIADAQGNVLPFEQILKNLYKGLFEAHQVTRVVNSRFGVTAKQVEKASKFLDDYNSLLREHELAVTTAEMKGGRMAAGFGEGSEKLLRAQKQILGARRRLGDLNEKYEEARRVTAQARGELEQYYTTTVQLTQKQRNQAIGMIFGARAMEGVAAILKGGIKSWEQYQKEVASAATALEQARKVSDTLIGKLTQLKNILVVLAVDAVLPLVEAYVSPFLGLVVDLARSIDGINPKLVKFGIVTFGVAASIGPSLLLLGQFLRVLKLVTSPLGILTLGLSGLAGAWSINALGIREWVGEIVGASEFLSRASESAREFKTMLDAGIDPVTSLYIALRKLGPAGESLRSFLKDVRSEWPNLIDAFRIRDPQAILESLNKMFDSAEENLGALFDQLWRSAGETRDAFVANFRAWWAESGDEIVKGMIGLSDTLMAGFLRHVFMPLDRLFMDSFSALILGLARGLRTGRLQQEMTRALKGLGAGLEPKFPKTAVVLEEIRLMERENTENFKRQLRGEWQLFLMDTFGTLSWDVITTEMMADFLAGLITAGINVWQDFGEWLVGSFDESFRKEAWLYKYMWKAFYNFGKGLIDGLYQGLVDGLAAIRSFWEQSLAELRGQSPGGPPVGGGSGGGAGGFPRGGYQYGGSFIADRPTWALFGEGSRELVTAVPLELLAQQRGGGPSVTLQIGTLIGDRRSIAMLKSEVLDAIQREQRYGIVR